MPRRKQSCRDLSLGPEPQDLSLRTELLDGWIRSVDDKTPSGGPWWQLPAAQCHRNCLDSHAFKITALYVRGGLLRLGRLLLTAQPHMQTLEEWRRRWKRKEDERRVSEQREPVDSCNSPQRHLERPQPLLTLPTVCSHLSVLSSCQALGEAMEALEEWRLKEKVARSANQAISTPGTAHSTGHHLPAAGCVCQLSHHPHCRCVLCAVSGESSDLRDVDVLVRCVGGGLLQSAGVAAVASTACWWGLSRVRGMAPVRKVVLTGGQTASSSSAR